MRYHIALIGGAILVGAARSAEPPAVAPAPREAPPIYCPKNPPPRMATQYVGFYWGRVTEIDREFSITLRAADGETKQFQIDPKLIGPPPANPFAWFGHRLADVRVGDVVRVEYHHRNGLDTCQAIDICRRPGGKIPPVPGESPHAPFRVHERLQAYQDWEEKGIPIPPEHLPVHPGLLAVPFPPVAPMPRKAGPKLKL